MTSFLNLASTFLTGIDILSNINNYPQLLKLMENSKDMDLRTFLDKFFRNTIAMIFDKELENVLEDEQMNSIFNNQELEKIDQVKLYMGQIVLHFYEKYKNIIEEYVTIERNDLLKILFERINHLIDYDSINCGKDVYNQLLDILCKNLVEMTFDPINEMSEHKIDNFTQENFIFHSFNWGLSFINNIIEYDPMFNNNDDNDDNDDNDNNNDDNNEDDLNNNKKRRNDGSKDSKPKKPRK